MDIIKKNLQKIKEEIGQNLREECFFVEDIKVKKDKNTLSFDHFSRLFFLIEN